MTVAADGTFSQDFTPPCTVGAGTHTVTVTAPSGQSASAPVTLNQCGATVRFAPNGGTGTMADQVSVVPAALTANAFTRPGYTFEAWNTAPDGTGTTYADGATYDFAHAGDTTLSAQWGVSQTITFGPLTNRTMLQSPFTVGATASSGLPVTFTAAPASVCTVSGTTVTLKGAGTCTITARQAGNATYAPAPNVSRPFTVSRVAQTITFGPLTNRTMLQSPFFVNATTSSALAGVFTATPASVCTINWTTVTLHGPGTCTITARQGGNATYLPAPPVSRSFTVSKAAQTITFAPLPNRTRAQSPFTVNATTSSGLPRTFSASPTSVCTVSGATVTLKAKGTCTITASQPGNAIYKAAPSVIRSFIVG